MHILLEYLRLSNHSHSISIIHYFTSIHIHTDLHNRSNHVILPSQRSILGRGINSTLPIRIYINTIRALLPMGILNGGIVLVSIGADTNIDTEFLAIQLQVKYSLPVSLDLRYSISDSIPVFIGISYCSILMAEPQIGSKGILGIEAKF